MRLLERDAAMRTLLSAFDRVGEGAGQLVFVSGEAGVGKTALITEFLRRVGDRARSLVASCDAVGATAPFGPLHELAGVLGPGLGDALRDGADKKALIAAILQGLNGGGLTVLIGEDAHWADEATLELVRFIGRRVHTMPALILILHRDDLATFHPLRRVLGDLTNAPAVSRLRLEPLSPAAVADLVASWHDSTLIADAAELHARTGGNPFLIAEVLAAGGAALPDTVRDAVLARVANLSSSARTLLGAAAVFGGRASLIHLTRLFGEPITDPLEECLTAGILLPHGEDVAFRHAISRDALLAGLSAVRRRAWHGRIVATLAPGVSDRDRGRLAQHADEAGDSPAVLALAPVAARHAADFGAHREAAELYARAIRHAADQPAAERATLLHAWSYECYLTGDLATAAAAAEELAGLCQRSGDQRGEGDATRWLSRLAWFTGDTALARERADRAYALLSTLPPGRELARAMSNLAQLAMLSQDSPAAIAWGERAIALADQLGEPEIAVHAAINVATARHALGESAGPVLLVAARERALALGLDDDTVRAYANLGFGSWRERALDRADGTLRAGIAFAADRDLVAMELYQRALLALVRLAAGDWSAAHAEAAALVDSPGGIAATKEYALLCIGRVAVLRREPSEALDRAAALADSMGELQRQGPAIAALAERAWLAGGALPVAELRAGYAEARRRSDPWLAGELGLWLHRAGEHIDPAGLAAPYAAEIAVRAEDRSGPDLGDSRAASAHAARLWRDIGCPLEAARARAAEDSEAALRAALAEFEELGAQADCARIATVLRRRGAAAIPRGRRATTRANPEHLTDRQLDVLRLVAHGATDAEIAAELVLSVKTVGHHVSAILAQLGVPNRHQAAARARALGLVKDGEPDRP